MLSCCVLFTSPPQTVMVHYVHVFYFSVLFVLSNGSKANVHRLRTPHISALLRHRLRLHARVAPDLTAM